MNQEERLRIVYAWNGIVNGTLIYSSKRFVDQALNSLKPFRAHIMLLCWEVSDYSNVTEGTSF